MSHPSNVVRLPKVPSLSWDDCRLLVESVVDYAIFMLDLDGHVATWNIGAERIKGYRADEIIGAHFSRFFTEEDLTAGKPKRELELAQEQGRYEDESWRVRKDGSRFWANVILTALRDESGNLRGFGKVTRDLTARRAAEEQLRQADGRFHQLVDAVVDYAIFMLDPTGHVATWNSGASRVKGYGAEEIIGQHFSVFYTPEDRAVGRHESILETVRREGRYEDEAWRVRKDGSRFWANVVITALQGDTGKLIGFAKVTRDLTERRRVEEELRRSEERFRLLLDNVGDHALYMLDPEGVVTTWNAGAARMTGYTADEILGQNFALFFPAADLEQGKPERELAAARAHGRFEDEGWRTRKDGSAFWANAILTALRDSTGHVIGFAKITRDLTSRREKEEAERHFLKEQSAREAAQEAEARLRESEERYRAISQRLEIVLEGVADGITVQDRTGRVVFANAAAAHICGFQTGAELMDASPADVFNRYEVLDLDGRPFDAAGLPARKALEGSGGSSATLHVRERATRREWWVLLRASAVLGPDGTPELAINIWHDVTLERGHERQAQYLADATAALGRSLDESEMLSTLAGQLVPVLGDWCSIHVLDGERLLDVALAQTGSSRAQAAKAYLRRFPGDPTHAGGVWGVIRSGKAEVLNGITEEMLKQITTDPEALQELHAVGMRAAVIAPLRVRDQVLGALAVISADHDRRYDATDLILLEEIGRRAGVALENARLYKSAQLAAKSAEEASRAKDEFLATVSHELRTPLNAIVGWSSILKGRVTDESLLKPIEVIYRNAQAQVKIIEDILDVSRVITGNFRIDAKPADLVAIARDAIEVVRPAALAKKLSIDFAPTDELCLLIADPERLQQVVWNLLSNAVKFTEQGGVICVRVGQQGSKMVLSVSDTGHGIDPAFLPHVFERFRQADSTSTRRFGGLGLGLALVRHIVELHGGQMLAESAGLNKGATFTMSLPVRAVSPQPSDSRAPLEVKVAKVVGLALHSVHVLVVDDEPDARDMVAEVLRSAGAIVDIAGSSAEAYDRFRQSRPDVLVSDIGMPDEDGYALMRRIRALPISEGARVPALALTAFTRVDDRTSALSAGYTTHLAKPVDPAGLVLAVANLAVVNLSS